MYNYVWNGGPPDDPGQEPWHIELCGLCRRIVDRDSDALVPCADGIVLHQHCADEVRADGGSL